MRQKLLEPFPFSGVHLSKSQVSKEAVWTWRWRGHGRSGHIPDLTQHGQDPPRENGRDWERLRDVMAPPGNRMHPQGGRAGLLHAVQETTGGHPQHCPHTPPKETQPEQHLGGSGDRGLATQTRSVPTGACVGFASPWPLRDRQRETTKVD